MTLHDLITNLKTKNEVEGILIAGSLGIGEAHAASDIDLALILNKNPLKIHSYITWIDGKPADVFVYETELLATQKASKEIAANSMDAVLLDWIQSGKIEFDRNGTIASFKNNIDSRLKKVHIPSTEMDSFDQSINAAYITNKRYFESGDSIYLESLDLKLLRDAYYVILGYFEFRDIPWRGEKKMLEYLKQHDPDYHALINQYFNARNVHERFVAYSKLVAGAFTGGYSLWDKNAIIPTFKNVADRENKAKAIAYWKELIS